jgi:hypothetical protein
MPGPAAATFSLAEGSDDNDSVDRPMRRPRVGRAWRTALLVLLTAVSQGMAAAQEFRQTQTDDYTRYELLDPSSHSFLITYDVSATTAGARYYFNAIRAGAEEEVHSVRDLATGRELAWRVVDGEEARRTGMTNARASGHYIEVTLARPVPEGGQGRVRIIKTYRDTASYFTDGQRIVFDRSLGIDRNAVVLPAGWEVVGANYPVQVAQEEDGRIRVSFMNRGPAAVPLRVAGARIGDGARPSTETPTQASTAQATRQQTVAGASEPAGARLDYRFGERAFEDRDITYFLQQPHTGSFRLFHDYTETRSGVDRYLNVVRAGSRATDPSAVDLDSGRALNVETLRGEEITRRGLDVGSVTPETEVVAIWFDPVPEGGSTRLRITETYTDRGRYVLGDGELIWDRSFGRARNTVVLPEGWYLTANAVPAVIDRIEDGRIRLRYINDRPGNIEVFVRARPRG